jgi:hypothetical protein
MPEKKTIDRAKKAKREHLSPSTQAGEFVREEIEHIREGKHGARSTEQAIAIGLSKARRAGVDLPVPEKGEASESTRKSARRDLAKGRKGSRKKVSAKRSRASKRRLQREGSSAVSKTALAKHARKAASKRTKAERSASARKGVHKRNHAERSASARKAARTRARKKAARKH